MNETIKSVGDKFVVYPKKGGKRLGTHDTRKAAEKQLAAIEINKNMNENYDNLYTAMGKPAGYDPDDLANKIAKVLNLGRVRRIGCGSFGCAYVTNDHRVLKLTTEAAEAANAERLVGKQPKHLAAYELVKKVKDKPIWIMVMPVYKSVGDKLSEMAVTMTRNIQMAFSQSMRRYKINSIPEYIKQLELNSSSFDGVRAHVRKNFGQVGLEVLDDVINMYLEMVEYGIDADDIHAENLGQAPDGRLVFFDMGTPSKDIKPVDSEITLDESARLADMVNDKLSTEPNVLATKIADHYGFNTNNIQELGCGYYGCAYEVAPNWVMKLSSDRLEAASAQHIKERGPYKHLPQYYSVNQVKDTNIWVLFMNKLQPLGNFAVILEEFIFYLNDAIADLGGGSQGKPFKLYYVTSESTRKIIKSKVYELAKDNQNLSKNLDYIFYQLNGLVKEMKSVGLRAFDFHTGNIRFSSDKNLVFFDLGDSEHTPKSPDNEISINERAKDDEHDIVYRAGSDGEDEYYIRATFNGKVVGEFAFYTVTADYSFFDDVMSEDEYDQLFPDDRWIDMQYLKVEPKWRTYGIGRELFKRGVQWAEEFGVPQYLNASPMGTDGPRARELADFYGQFGFHEVVDQGDNVIMYRGAEAKALNEKKWSERWSQDITRGPANPLYTGSSGGEM